MTEIVSVCFKDSGKVYYFSPGDLKVNPGDYVVVETSRGVECARAVGGNKKVEEDSIVSPLKSVLRIATKNDLDILESNRKKKRKLTRYAAAKSRNMNST